MYPHHITILLWYVIPFNNFYMILSVLSQLLSRRILPVKFCQQPNPQLDSRFTPNKELTTYKHGLRYTVMFERYIQRHIELQPAK